MERNRYTHNSKKIERDFGWIPAWGYAIGWEPKYREFVMILGCFILSVEFRRTRTKKRK